MANAVCRTRVRWTRIGAELDANLELLAAGATGVGSARPVHCAAQSRDYTAFLHQRFGESKASTRARHPRRRPATFHSKHQPLAQAVCSISRYFFAGAISSPSGTLELAIVPPSNTLKQIRACLQSMRSAARARPESSRIRESTALMLLNGKWRAKPARRRCCRRASINAGKVRGSEGPK